MSSYRLVFSLCLMISGIILFTPKSQAFSLYDHGLAGLGYTLMTGKTNIEPVADNDSSEGAKKFIDTMGQRAISFLGNDNLNQKQKEEEFRKLLRTSFDMRTIGRFAIGRYWRTASKEQQKEYTGLFEQMVVSVYAQRFKDYQGQTFDVRSYRSMNEKDTLVTSFIVPGEGPDVQVDWRVRYKNGQYKIIDVIIEGVSMSQTQRSDFSSVIQRGGGNVAVLLDHLRSKQG